MVIPVSASPSLEDSHITYSVKGYFIQYGFSSSWTTGKILSDGSVVTSGVGYTGYSDYFEVSPGGTVFLFSSSSSNLLTLQNICFYDSSYNVVAGGSDSPSAFYYVPNGAFYARLSQSAILDSRALIICSPQYVNFNSYTYLFNEISDITISNGVVSIPYQSYSYTSVFLDLEFYPNSYYLSNFGLDVFTYFSSPGLPHIDNTVNEYLDENVIELYMYHFDHGEKQFVFIDDSISNPTSFTESFNSRQPFSGFRLYIPVSYNGSSGSVSTSLQIELSNFYVDSKEAVYSAEADKIVDDKGEAVSGLIDDLVVPTPNTTDLFSGMDDVVQAVNSQQFSTVISAMWQNGIIPLFMLLSVSFSVLGYILFGKSG